MWKAAALGSLLCATNVLAQEKSAVAIMDITGTIDPALLPTLTEILTVEVDALGMYKVIAGRDIQAMLGFEKQKDVLGCTDSACLAEIGGALGVDRIVQGHIGSVGSTFVVNIKLINIRMADTEGRVYETVKGEVDALIETVRKSVRNLLGPGSKAAAALGVGSVAAAPAPAAAAPAVEEKKADAVAPAVKKAPAVEKKAKSGGGVGLGSIMLIGVGAAAAGGGGYFGWLAGENEKCANSPTCNGGQKAAEAAPDQALIATIAYGAGGLIATIGLFAALFGGPGDDDEATAAITPVMTGREYGLAFSGSF